MRDYYKILGVGRTATADQLKRAYREKAKQYHPDVNTSRGANSRFQLVGEAYETLVHHDRRRRYDLKLKYRDELMARSRYGRNMKYRRKPGTYYRYHHFKTQSNAEKDKMIIYLEVVLFLSMITIGIFAFIFSIYDLNSDSWKDEQTGINGMLFSCLFLFLLIFGWWLYKKRK